MWQDWVMGGCVGIFMVALLPQVVQGFRWRAGFVTWPTSLLTGLCCCALGVCLWTLGARLTAVLDAAMGGLWLVLLAQRLIYGPPAMAFNGRIEDLP